jgi:hypothetical protein
MPVPTADRKSRPGTRALRSSVAVFDLDRTLTPRPPPARRRPGERLACHRTVLITH